MTTATPGTGEPFDGTNDVEDLSRPFYGVSFGGAVKRFFKNYANFTGRASRSEYWFAALFMFLVYLIPGIIASVGGDSGLGIFGNALTIIIGLAVLVPGLAITWRRLHDANFAGPFWFLTFVPFVGSLIVFIFMLLPSKPEGRRFASSK